MREAEEDEVECVVELGLSVLLPSPSAFVICSRDRTTFPASTPEPVTRRSLP